MLWACFIRGVKGETNVCTCVLKGLASLANYLSKQGGNQYQYSDFYYLQRTFQVVIMTDGNISYAELHYENRTVIHNTNFPAAVGFDGGDGRSNELYINFLGGNRSEGVLLDRERNGTLLFRIDGK